ncbi:SchA/CurD-like domain-containing protein [Streptomyces sp. NPDC017979]|uniref:SchA/CurD-like domain-containing protein n=1 Tax=Streptomyces sp. NPDC017979 TaxID=3365024 RepID=UPI00379A4BB2
MTTLSERISQSVFDGSRLRVILLLDLHEGAQREFLEAYEHMRNSVASVPGHISDQLCQSIENPSQWLITSEWESAPPFLAWVNSEEHVQTVQPLHSCVRDTRSLKFNVLRETGQAFSVAPEQQRRPPADARASVRVGDGVVRHALTFTVRPGSEETVAKILAGYSAPAARVDDHTRLQRTSLFMHGNRVVRAIEVQGDLMAALRHVARQPEVRAVEEAINPYLEQDRDLDDPNSARIFFTRAALPAVHHVSGEGRRPREVNRHALFYEAKEGCGLAVARLLSEQDEAAAAHPEYPIVSSTVFHREDLVVRLVDVSGPIEDHAVAALGVQGPRKAAALARLLVDGDRLPTALDVQPGDAAVARYVSRVDMQLITDRLAPEEN